MYHILFFLAFHSLFTELLKTRIQVTLPYKIYVPDVSQPKELARGW